MRRKRKGKKKGERFVEEEKEDEEGRKTYRLNGEEGSHEAGRQQTATCSDPVYHADYCVVVVLKMTTSIASSVESPHCWDCSLGVLQLPETDGSAASAALGGGSPPPLFIPRPQVEGPEFDALLVGLAATERGAEAGV